MAEAALDPQSPAPAPAPRRRPGRLVPRSRRPSGSDTAGPNELMTQAHIDQYWEEGYTIIRNVLAPHEVAQLAQSCDRWKFVGELLGRTWRRQNTVIWVDQVPGEDGQTESIMRGMQWPSYHDAVMDHYRTDPRLLRILEPLLGSSIKQIINQLHWKKPGSKITWPLHRDVRSRMPIAAFCDLFTSWVQTGIAIDAHRAENGAMQVVPGSHRDIPHDPHNAAAYNVPQYQDDPRIRDMSLNPGDVALWSAYTVHGGGFNTTAFMDRRLYINGFIKADKCLRGEWAWRDGRTCHLHGRPALVQFDEIDDVTEGFYPADRQRQEAQRD